MDAAHNLLQEKKDLTLELASMKENLKASDAAEVCCEPIVVHWPIFMCTFLV